MLGGLLPLSPSLGAVSSAPSAVPNAALLAPHIPLGQALQVTSPISVGMPTVSMMSHHQSLHTSSMKDVGFGVTLNNQSGLLLAKSTDFHGNQRSRLGSQLSREDDPRKNLQHERSFEKIHQTKNSQFDRFGYPNKKISSSSTESGGNSAASKVATSLLHAGLHHVAWLLPLFH